MDNILDHVVVQGQRYDIVSPTAFGDYIETIGSACINPDGYAKGSTFLARLGNEQFYYEATAAITQGSAISEGTNCKKTTVAEYVDSVNEAFTNYAENIDSVIFANGAVNLFPLKATSQVIDGITFSVNTNITSNDYNTISVGGTASAIAQLPISDVLSPTEGLNLKQNLRVTGIPQGAGNNIYMIFSIANRSTSAWIRDVVVHEGTVNITLGANEYIKIGYLMVSANTVVTTPVVVKPMITVLDQPNSDYAHYVPYAKTNRELTEIGKYYSYDIQNFSLANNVENNLLLETFPAGVYIVSAYVDDFAKTKHNKSVRLDAGTEPNIVRAQGNNEDYKISICGVCKLNADGQGIAIKVYQNSGDTVTLQGRVTITKIG